MDTFADPARRAGPGHRVTLRVTPAGRAGGAVRAWPAATPGEEVERITSDAERTGKTLEQLGAAGQDAGMEEPPRRLESYDISHTAGPGHGGLHGGVRGRTAPEAGLSPVPGKDSGPRRRPAAPWRRCWTRRFRRYLDGDEHFAPLPDLLLMDGGQLQARGRLPGAGKAMGLHRAGAGHGEG